MSDFKKIWSDDAEGFSNLTEAQLMAYLEDRMPPEERRVVEEILSGEGPESDAIDGLQALGINEAQSLKHKLNADLQRSVHKKGRHRRKMADQGWTWLAIGLILFLAVLGYYFIFLVRHR